MCLLKCLEKISTKSLCSDFSPTLKSQELSHLSALNFRSDLKYNFTKCASSEMPQYVLKHLYHICINNQSSRLIIKTVISHLCAFQQRKFQGYIFCKSVLIKASGTLLFPTTHYVPKCINIVL